MPSVASPIGVIVVTFNSADVILDCLESLLGSEGVRPNIVVVDNASSDNTVQLLRDWAAGKTAYTAPDDLPFALTAQPKPLSLPEFQMTDRPGVEQLGDITLVHADTNRGFAGGVNIGLAVLAAVPGIDHFWVLNPDAAAAPDAAAQFLARAERTPGYALMGGRVCYAEPPHRVQIDGGTVNVWTGVTGNINLTRLVEDAPFPTAERLDFVTGASMVASRAFYEKVGPMREDYFLYYEEVDWAYRRGDMPMIVTGDAVVYHRAGSSIGSPTMGRIASPFSIWFKHRGRMRFIRRFRPAALPVAWAYSLLKAAQMAMQGALPQAKAVLQAVHGLRPSPAVRDRLSPEAARIAFGPPEPRKP